VSVVIAERRSTSRDASLSLPVELWRLQADVGGGFVSSRPMAWWCCCYCVVELAALLVHKECLHREAFLSAWIVRWYCIGTLACFLVLLWCLVDSSVPYWYVVRCLVPWLVVRYSGLLSGILVRCLVLCWHCVAGWFIHGCHRLIVIGMYDSVALSGCRQGLHCCAATHMSTCANTGRGACNNICRHGQTLGPGRCYAHKCQHCARGLRVIALTCQFCARRWSHQLIAGGCRSLGSDGKQRIVRNCLHHASL
jgi:hypothetical protein